MSSDMAPNEESSSVTVKNSRSTHATSRSKAKKVRPMDISALLDKVTERQDTEYIIRSALYDVIFAKAANILHTHDIQRNALEKTARETVALMMASVRTARIQYDPDEPILHQYSEMVYTERYPTQFVDIPLQDEASPALSVSAREQALLYGKRAGAEDWEAENDDPDTVVDRAADPKRAAIDLVDVDAMVDRASGRVLPTHPPQYARVAVALPLYQLQLASARDTAAAMHADLSLLGLTDDSEAAQTPTEHVPGDDVEDTEEWARVVVRGGTPRERGLSCTSPAEDCSWLHVDALNRDLARAVAPVDAEDAPPGIPAAAAEDENAVWGAAACPPSRVVFGGFDAGRSVWQRLRARWADGIVEEEAEAVRAAWGSDAEDWATGLATGTGLHPDADAAERNTHLRNNHAVYTPERLPQLFPQHARASHAAETALLHTVAAHPRNTRATLTQGFCYDQADNMLPVQLPAAHTLVAVPSPTHATHAAAPAGEAEPAGAALRGRVTRDLDHTALRPASFLLSALTPADIGAAADKMGARLAVVRAAAQEAQAHAAALAQAQAQAEAQAQVFAQEQVQAQLTTSSPSAPPSPAPVLAPPPLPLPRAALASPSRAPAPPALAEYPYPLTTLADGLIFRSLAAHTDAARAGSSSDAQLPTEAPAPSDSTPALALAPYPPRRSFRCFARLRTLSALIARAHLLSPAQLRALAMPRPSAPPRATLPAAPLTSSPPPSPSSAVSSLSPSPSSSPAPSPAASASSLLPAPTPIALAPALRDPVAVSILAFLSARVRALVVLRSHPAQAVLALSPSERLLQATLAAPAPLSLQPSSSRAIITLPDPLSHAHSASALAAPVPASLGASPSLLGLPPSRPPAERPLARAPTVHPLPRLSALFPHALLYSHALQALVFPHNAAHAAATEDENAPLTLSSSPSAAALSAYGLDLAITGAVTRSWTHQFAATVALQDTHVDLDSDGGDAPSSSLNPLTRASLLAPRQSWLLAVHAALSRHTCPELPAPLTPDRFSRDLLRGVPAQLDAPVPPYAHALCGSGRLPAALCVDADTGASMLVPPPRDRTPTHAPSPSASSAQLHASVGFGVGATAEGRMRGPAAVRTGRFNSTAQLDTGRTRNAQPPRTPPVSGESSRWPSRWDPTASANSVDLSSHDSSTHSLAPQESARAVPLTGTRVDLRSLRLYSNTVGAAAVAALAPPPAAATQTDKHGAHASLAGSGTISALASASPRGRKDTGQSLALQPIAVPPLVTEHEAFERALRDQELRTLLRERKLQAQVAEAQRRIAEEEARVRELQERLAGREYCYDREGKVVLVQRMDPSRMPALTSVPTFTVSKGGAQPPRSEQGKGKGKAKRDGKKAALEEPTSTTTLTAAVVTSAVPRAQLDASLIQPPLSQTVQPAAHVTFTQAGVVKVGAKQLPAQNTADAVRKASVLSSMTLQEYTAYLQKQGADKDVTIVAPVDVPGQARARAREDSSRAQAQVRTPPHTQEQSLPTDAPAAPVAPALAPTEEDDQVLTVSRALLPPITRTRAATHAVAPARPTAPAASAVPVLPVARGARARPELRNAAMRTHERAAAAPPVLAAGTRVSVAMDKDAEKEVHATKLFKYYFRQDAASADAKPATPDNVGVVLPM